MHIYKDNSLEYIEKSLAFQNQRMLGTIVGKEVHYNPSAPGGGQFISDFRLREAKKTIAELGVRLAIEDYYVRQAQNLFSLLQAKSFTQGRPTSLVALGCLYLICRQNKTGHMMCDFVRAVERVNVYAVSKIYLKICQTTHQSVTAPDPSLYVMRFARQMTLPTELERDILAYANQLLLRMRIDWMSQGRRPAGLIAAAIYIACKCFGIAREVRDVAEQIGVSVETVRKRVNEFRALKIAQLTREEFSEQIQAFEPEDPPAFSRGRLAELSNIAAIPVLALSESAQVEDELIGETEFEKEEIEQLLLAPTESELKEKAWQRDNADWVREQQIKAETLAKRDKSLCERRKEYRDQTQRKSPINDDSLSFKSTNPVVDSIMSNTKLARHFDPLALERLFNSLREGAI